MAGAACPACGFEPRAIPAEFWGHKVKCPKCKESYRLPEQGAIVPAPPPPQPSVAMPSHAPPIYFAQPAASPVNIMVAETKSNSVATAAFVIGLLSLFLFWVPFIGIILCIVGAITAGVGLFFALRGQGGMTFSIIGGVLSFAGLGIYVLAFIVLAGSFGRVLDAVEKNRAEQARAQIDSLQTPVNTFLLDQGRYPYTLEELWTTSSKGTSKIAYSEPVLSDPWGKPYEYEPPASPDSIGGRYRIWSRGKDGISGTADDITN